MIEILFFSKFLLLYSIISLGLLALRAKINSSGGKNVIDIDSIFKEIYAAGYSYDQYQDIFYSNLDAWQRRFGYCRLYDEAAALLGMIVDCEPIYFEYGNKRWLIEFWKGQYYLNTGAEIGIYTPAELDLYINGVFKGAFYNCAADEDLLDMSFVLKKKGKEILKREGKHWWLTGFKLGEFSDPSELTLSLSITLKDKEMCSAFIKGLKKSGYIEDEITISENTVSLEFDKPRTSQPITRIPETDFIIQIQNELLCYHYEDITSPYDNFTDKMNAIEKKAPELFEEVLKIGKSKEVFEIYKLIEYYVY